MANKQVGRQMFQKKAPKFDSCVVRGGTWEEEDSTKVDMNENEDEETFNVTARDRGDNAKCEVFADAGFAVEVLDVLPEVANDDNPDPRDWVVVPPLNRKNFGNRALIFVLNLIRRDALDTSLVS